MKIVLLPVILFFLIGTGYAQSNVPGCSAFKEGTFSYRDSIEKVVRTITRKRNTQTESTINSKIKTKFRIKWLSDCEYKLTQIWTNDKRRKILNRRYWIYKVTTLTEKSFSYSCTCANDKVISGIVVKTD